MHDGKAVTFAQHFLKIGELVTVQFAWCFPPPSLPVLARGCRNVVLQQVGSYLGSTGRCSPASARQVHCSEAGLGPSFRSGAIKSGLTSSPRWRPLYVLLSLT